MSSYFFILIHNFNKFSTYNVTVAWNHNQYKDLIFNKDERKEFNIRLALYREARNKLNSQMLNCINLINSATSEVNLQQIEKRLNDKILEVQNQVNDLNSKIGNINSRLSNIESRLDALENNTNV